MKQEARRLLSFLLMAGLVGWLVDYPAWALAIGLLSYTALHLRTIE